jgi:hypothetical protein
MGYWMAIWSWLVPVVIQQELKMRMKKTKKNIESQVDGFGILLYGNCKRLPAASTQSRLSTPDTTGLEDLQ